MDIQQGLLHPGFLLSAQIPRLSKHMVSEDQLVREASALLS